MMSSKCGPWWGRKGASSSFQPGWGAASSTLLLPFYLLDQKQLAYRFQRTGLRNVSTWPTLHYPGQEQRTLAVAAIPLLPILYWGHVWNQPCLGLMLVFWLEAAS